MEQGCEHELLGAEAEAHRLPLQVPRNPHEPCTKNTWNKYLLLSVIKTSSETLFAPEKLMQSNTSSNNW